MKKLLAVLTLLIPFSSIGALINADWLNAGDNRAVLDTTTGLEWLDMKATNSYSYNEVIERLDSTFLGWRLATEFEVNQLMNINIPESIGLSGWDQFPDTPEMYNFRTVFGKYQGYSLMRYVPENWDPASDRVFAAGVRAETGSVYLDYDSGGADSQLWRQPLRFLAHNHFAVLELELSWLPIS